MVFDRKKATGKRKSTLDIFNRWIMIVVMAKTLGIIGGGQLGMMLTEAAQKMPEISKVKHDISMLFT